MRRWARSSAVRETRRCREDTASYAHTTIIEPAADPVDDEALLLDRRRSPRSALAGSDLCIRRIGGFSFQARLKDVSTDGCRVEMIEECQAGEDLIARFPHLEPLGAWVRWTLGPIAGVEFMRPIHAAVFTALVKRLKWGTSSG